MIQAEDEEEYEDQEEEEDVEARKNQTDVVANTSSDHATGLYHDESYRLSLHHVSQNTHDIPRSLA